MKPVVLGITGSIGMGKSAVTAMLKEQGIPVHEADKCAHALLEKDQSIIAKITETFPETVESGVVNRQKLGHLVFKDRETLKKLEAILHPAVEEAQRAFIAQHQADSIVGLDIPLLYECGCERLCDYVLAVNCAPEVQAQRVLNRPGMTLERFKAIKALQMPNEEKLAKADFVIQTDQTKESTLHNLQEVLEKIKTVKGQS